MLISILLAWLSASLGLWISSKLMSRVRLASFQDAIWAGALLGVLQWLLTIPIAGVLVLGTLGIGLILWFITRWVVIAIVIKITAALSSRLEVDGFLPAVVTGFIIAITGSVLRWLL